MPLLGLILPWWAKYAAIAALCVGLVAFGWVKGNAHGTAKLDSYIQKQAQEATRIGKVRTAITEKVLTRYITQTVPQTQVVTNTVNQEVIRYVESNPTGMCIDSRWISLHNSAALNAIPEGSGIAP